MSKNTLLSPLNSQLFDLDGQKAIWLSHSTIKPPQQLILINKQQTLSVNAALDHWRGKCATVWQGDYHQAKALLDAAKRRLNKPHKPSATLLDTFHKHRLQQQQRSQLLSHLCVLLEPNWQLNLPRAPNVQTACRQAFGFDNQEPVLLPLHALLGYVGAEQWHQRGIEIDALDKQRIHVPFGVFSPLRGEYLDLLLQADLPKTCETAWDIGTGSGVLAAILAKRNIKHIIATDTNPIAIAASKANINRLGYTKQISITAQDLFPEGKADLIVCNPPWLPGKPSAAIESALYDPNSQMLKAFLNGVAQRLNPQGQAWLIMSDLAERIGLRKQSELKQWIDDAGLRMIERLETRPTHAKTERQDDPLYTARSQEITSLYRLERL